MSSSRYSTQNLRFALRNPRVFLGELHRLGTSLNRRYHRLSRDEGTSSVADEEWDTLVILDACRYDTFEKIHRLDGHLEQRTSPASESRSFLDRSFAGREMHDTIYVSANLYTDTLPQGTFYWVVNLLKSHWDPERETVLPADVVSETLSIHEENPDKRLIVHFMQPHYPFIGPTGRNLTQAGIGGESDSEIVGTADIWLRALYGLEDTATVKRAYEENLELVLEHVETLLTELDGLSVVTADHGNLFGERTGPLPARGYGHPPDILVSSLTSVPWFIAPSEERRAVRSDSPVRTERLDDELTDDRLRALGYK
jgi:hypothetical protein